MWSSCLRNHRPLTQALQATFAVTAVYAPALSGILQSHSFGAKIRTIFEKTKFFGDFLILHSSFFILYLLPLPLIPKGIRAILQAESNTRKAMGKKNSSKGGSIVIHRPKTQSEFNKLNRELNGRRYVAIDLLKPGRVRDISLAVGDAANAGASDMAASMGCGSWSNGPLSRVAWSFDGRTDTVEHVCDKDGKDLGDYVKWHINDTPDSH